MATPTTPPRSPAMQAVTAFLEDIAAHGETSDCIASAAASSLTGITTSSLPPEGHPLWRDLARRLKAPADRPLPERAVEAMRSWPNARGAEIIDLVRRLHAVLQQRENEHWEDEIRDKLRHNYL